MKLLNLKIAINMMSVGLFLYTTNSLATFQINPFTLVIDNDDKCEVPDQGNHIFRNHDSSKAIYKEGRIKDIYYNLFIELDIQIPGSLKEFKRLIPNLP